MKLLSHDDHSAEYRQMWNVLLHWESRYDQTKQAKMIQLRMNRTKHPDELEAIVDYCNQMLRNELQEELKYAKDEHTSRDA
jgi:phosphoribosylformylglycinamidine (FGAM) synthase PurS component